MDTKSCQYKRRHKSRQISPLYSNFLLTNNSYFIFFLLFRTTSIPNGKLLDSYQNNKLYMILPYKLQHFPPFHLSYSRKAKVGLNGLPICHTYLTRSCLLNKEQAVRVATQYASPFSPAPGTPPNTCNIAVLSHAEYVPTLTATAALRVKAAPSKVAW